ncbi:MAG: hypothetical protein GY737_26875 [Desulfobacteraceae bacterium]|nr:hypothetical protein [Desulfobacteraceae bacterium]
MGKKSAEKRSEERCPIEPSDTGHLLKAVISGREYRFKVLNICQGGIGMLVKASQDTVLATLQKGVVMKMNYINPKGTLEIKVEMRHATRFSNGPYEGDFCVGFSLSV